MGREGRIMGNFFMRLFTGIHARLYKATGGRFFGGGSVIVLTHRGAKSGRVRDTPVMSFRDGDNYMVVASAGGSDKHPGWYHNLIANPETVINDHGQEITVKAIDAGARRDELFEKVVAEDPRFGEYTKKTDRVIPVVLLVPRSPAYPDASSAT
jgi:deazaflavin-dependent oxidoreductase (nitroreductase family)